MAPSLGPHSTRPLAPSLTIATLAPVALAAMFAPPVPWPLSGRLFRFVDQIGHAWHYWDLARAVREGGPLLSSTQVQFPVGADHLLHRGGHLLVALSWPLQVLGADPAGAVNLLTLLSLATTALAGALLAARASRTPGAMLVGACGLALCRPLYRQLLQGQTEEVLLGLGVIFGLLLWDGVSSGSRARLVGAGLLGALCLYANLEFGLFGAIVAASTLPALVWGQPRAVLWRAARRAALALGVAALGAAPLVVAFLLHYRTAGTGGTSREALSLCIDMQPGLSVSVPALWGGAPGAFQATPSLLLLALAGYGAWHAPVRVRAAWGAVVGVLFVLSLGPRLQWPRVLPPLPLPLLLLDHGVPLFARMNFPIRYLAVAHVGLVALAAVGAAETLRRLGRWRAWGRLALVGLGLGVGAESLWGTLRPEVVDAPGAPMPATAAMQDEEPYAVIEVPFFDLRGRTPEERFLQRCLHGKPTLDAMGSPFLKPAPLRAFDDRHPILAGLRRILEDKSISSASSPTRADAAVLGDLGFRYLVVHQDVLAPSERTQIADLLDPILGGPVPLGAAMRYTLPTTTGEPALITSLETSRAALTAWNETHRKAPHPREKAAEPR